MRDHLCALSVARETLILTTLRYATEIVAPPDFEPMLETAPLDTEIAMAEQLIDAMTTRFRPERYRDDYQEHVVSLLRHKAGDTASTSRKPVEPTATVNLTESLAASLKGRREPARPTAHDERTSAPH
jgi:DNA end-binding protein Ku